MLELYLIYTNIPIEKKSCKRNLVDFGGPNGLKMIFILLTKVVAVHMQLIIIYFWYFSHKGLLVLCQKLFWSLIQLQVSLHELFE